MLNQINAMNTETWVGNLIGKSTQNKNIKILFSIITVFLGSLLLIASAKIKVPLYPVPMTLQPMAVLIIAMLFGRNLATLTVGLYIFKGIIGLPVFAYGGGLMYLMGPTGGFILGFFASAIIIGYLADRGWGKKFSLSIISMLIGMVIIYTLGIFQLAFLNGFNYALLKGFYPFLLGDFYKLILLGIVIPYVWRFAK